ncbi:glycoside hydrolase family 10 protein [Sunxiuqinia sp. A32]|uniref:glycoside hydrolase family 10 protein n=1 Tax=Sunxiuqinia sp. A32 TaxID=3461496 RepID=UPI004046391A
MRFFLYVLFILTPVLAIAQVNPKHEFRAAWVATVSNVDWPSKPGLSIDQQKSEAIRLLETLQKNGFNAVIFQVRPASDAFYPSKLEPWSRYLTGTPGKSPGYDPLAFWIEESHKRNMEFHAWFNPYRVAQKADEPLASTHIAFQHPEWVIKYGDKLYFDPGLPQTQDFIAQVVLDVVSRYDVDAIHFDDYFYPYPIAGSAFPDTASFRRYNRGYSVEQIADWRRDNVNQIIQKLDKTIKSTKPWVKFGISPFGVWRNKKDDVRGSDSSAGTTNYDQLYADILKWQEEGWIDYMLPQLYWEFGHPAVDYAMLSQWWNDNSFNRAYYIGHAVYKLDPASPVESWKKSEQLTNQIRSARKLANFRGSAFFSAKHFYKQLDGFKDSLQQKIYNSIAIVPAMPWMDNQAPDKPAKLKKGWFKKIKWEKPLATHEMNEAKRFIIYKNPVGTKFDPENPHYIEKITNHQKIKLERGNGSKRDYEIRVSALDRLNNESITTKPVIVKL